MRWAGDRCSVCDSDVDFDSDQLVSCDLCGITVHQSCYGVPELPGVDDMWLCRACELKVRCLALPCMPSSPCAACALLLVAEDDGLLCRSAGMQCMPDCSRTHAGGRKGCLMCAAW